MSSTSRWFFWIMWFINRWHKLILLIKLKSWFIKLHFLSILITTYSTIQISECINLILYFDAWTLISSICLFSLILMVLNDHCIMKEVLSVSFCFTVARFHRINGVYWVSVQRVIFCLEFKGVVEFFY